MKFLVLLNIFLILTLVRISKCDLQTDILKKRLENVKKHHAKFNISGINIPEYLFLEEDGPRMTGATPAVSANFPWIATVIELPTATTALIKVGPGVFTSTKHLFLHFSTAFAISELANAAVVAKTDTIGQFSGANVVVRRVKNILFDSSASYPKVASYLAILVICPPVDASFVAPMPTQVGPYAVGTPITYYNYMDAFSTATKTIAASASCTYGIDKITPVSETFCVANNGPIKIQSSDYLGTIAVIDGKFAGINALSTANQGEIFLDVRFQLAYINNPK